MQFHFDDFDVLLLFKDLKECLWERSRMLHGVRVNICPPCGRLERLTTHPQKPSNRKGRATGGRATCVPVFATQTCAAAAVHVGGCVAVGDLPFGSGYLVPEGAFRGGGGRVREEQGDEC